MHTPILQYIDMLTLSHCPRLTPTYIHIHISTPCSLISTYIAIIHNPNMPMWDFLWHLPLLKQALIFLLLFCTCMLTVIIAFFTVLHGTVITYNVFVHGSLKNWYNSIIRKALYLQEDKIVRGCVQIYHTSKMWNYMPNHLWNLHAGELYNIIIMIQYA